MIHTQTRLLTQDDAAALDAYLAPHTAEAYFMRGNALRRGLVYRDEAMHADYFGVFFNGQLAGVLAHHWNGNLQAQVDAPPLVRPLADYWRQHKPRRKVAGVIGQEEAARELTAYLRIPEPRYRIFEADTLFVLATDALVMPVTVPGLTLRRAEREDAKLLIQWRTAFNIESVNAVPGPALDASVREEITRRIKDDLYVLCANNQPVSMLGSLVSVPGCAIVGPVWTPPDLRGKGFARQALALTLQKQRAENNLSQAVLFTNNPTAARLYEAVGFRQKGTWLLGLLRTPYMIG